MGSGEFEPWAEPVDRGLLALSRRGDGHVAILPTASWNEGKDVFDGWAQKGMDYYGSLGIPAEVVALRDREDANRPEVVDRLRTASMVFFSGGNPAYLAATLIGTPFWRALRSAMREGLAYAGCSAGVACLGKIAPDSDRETLDSEIWRTGLNLFPRTAVMPHWDMLDEYVPGLIDFVKTSVPFDHRLLTIDEETAMIGDGAAWSVAGKGGVGVRSGRSWRRFSPGEDISLRLVRPPTGRWLADAV
jgi:cyanophycinase